MAVLSVALAAGAGLTAGARPAAGQLGCDAVQGIPDLASFDSRVCDMPDYDQRRRTATVAGDGRTRKLIGLVAQGGCHCVPTSLTDLLGYYAFKGIDIPPGTFAWWSRAPFAADPGEAGDDPVSSYLSLQPYSDAEIGAYNDVSLLIKALGSSVVVDEDSCGTHYEYVVDMFQLLSGANFGHAMLGFGLTETGAKAGRNMAAIMYNGGLVSVAYGKYKDYERTGTTVSVGERDGGHAVAVTGVKGTFKQFDLSYNNPSIEEDELRQSVFENPTRNLLRLKSSIPVFGQQWLYRFGPDTGEEIQRLVDKYLAVYPQILIAGKGDNLTVVSGYDLNRQDGTQKPAKPNIKIKPVVKKIHIDGSLVDAVAMPLTGEVAYVAKASDSIKAVVPGTGQVRTLGPAPAGTVDLEASPTGKFVFALGRRSVTTLARDGGVLERTRLGVRGSALAYDWAEDRPWKQRLAVLSRRAQRLTLLDPQSLRKTGGADLPGRLLAGSGRVAASFGAGGRLQIRVGDGPLRTRGGSARSLPRTTAGFATTDAGLLITGRDGAIAARRLPIDGVRIGGARILGISHSGADFARAQRDDLIDETDPAIGPEPEPGEPIPTPSPTATATATAGPTQTPTVSATPSPMPNIVIDAAADTQAVVRNAGDAAAGAFTVTLTRSGDTPLEFRVDGLAAGATATVDYDCRRETRTLTADAGSAIAESDEADNVTTFTSACISPRLWTGAARPGLLR